MKTTILTIVTSVVAGLLLAAIIFFMKSRFGTQPKLRVRVLPGPSSSTSGQPGNIKCRWEKRLEICNLTDFPALDVSFIWLDSTRQLPLPTLDPPYVSSMDTKVLDFEIVKEFPREQVTCHGHDRFKKLLPMELQAFVLILQYQNNKGIRFYTRYERNGETENSTFHRLKPKLGRSSLLGA